MRLSAMRSMTACDSRKVVVAAALSPVAICFLTFLTAVRSADFRLALRWRVGHEIRSLFENGAALASHRSRVAPCSDAARRFGASRGCGRTWKRWSGDERPGIIRDFCIPGKALRSIPT